MKRSALVSGFALACALAAGSVFAQMGTATGKVVDGDGKPVASVHVRFETSGNHPISRESKTNEKGEFVIITAQTEGPWMITLTKQGHLTYVSEQPVRVPLGGLIEIPTITLWAEGDKRAPVKMTKEEAARIEAALKAFEALKAQVDQAVSLVDEGQAAQKAGNNDLARQKYDQAVAAYKALLAENPNIAEIHFNLGVAYKYMQQWELAAASFLKASELRPQMVEAYSAASGAWLNAGETANAMEILTKAVASHPDNPKLQFLMAVTAYNSAEYGEAATLFNKIRQSDPANSEPYYYLGMIAVAQNRVNEGVSLLEKYLAMNPSNAQNLQAAKDVIGALKPKK